jgi:hypothetical protein
VSSRLGFVVAAVALGALGVLSCTSGDPPPGGADSGRVDCVFVQDEGNCWRTFVQRVDTCLGQSDAGVIVGQGVLDDAGMSCTYASRTILATGQGLDRPQGSEKDPLTRAFTVVRDGRVCLDMKQAGTTVTLTSEGTVLSWKSDAHTFELTCGGRVLQGDSTQLLECITAKGGLPGYAYRNTDTTAWFTLLGMNAPAYDCLRTDAGADAGGD